MSSIIPEVLEFFFHKYFYYPNQTGNWKCTVSQKKREREKKPLELTQMCDLTCLLCNPDMWSSVFAFNVNVFHLFLAIPLASWLKTCFSHKLHALTCFTLPQSQLLTSLRIIACDLQGCCIDICLLDLLFLVFFFFLRFHYYVMDWEELMFWKVADDILWFVDFLPFSFGSVLVIFVYLIFFFVSCYSYMVFISHLFFVFFSFLFCYNSLSGNYVNISSEQYTNLMYIVQGKGYWFWEWNDLFYFHFFNERMCLSQISGMYLVSISLVLCCSYIYKML